MHYLLLDCHGLCYRAHYSLRQLSHAGSSTEVSYGFFMELLRLGERYKPAGFVFCWDGGIAKRLEIFPEYKAFRREAPDDPEELAIRRQIYEQANALRDDIIPMMGFSNRFLFMGYEADDLMAKCALDNPLKRFTVCSSDHDMFQMLAWPNVQAQHLLNSGKSINASQFYATYGIPARRWADVKALAGCSSDGVPGVVGIGEKTAVRILTSDLVKGKKIDALRRNQHVVRRNRKLVTLPFPGLPELKIEDENSAVCGEMFQVFDDLGFASMLTEEMRKRWREVLCRKRRGFANDAD
jgi:5'-3' exonuclease